VSGQLRAPAALSPERGTDVNRIGN